MRKTIFLSNSRNVSRNSIPCMAAPYIFFNRGKWQEDEWYYLSLSEIKKEANKQGFLIR